MDAKEVIVEAMNVRGYNQTMLAEKAGFKRQSNISELFRSKNMRVDNLLKLLDAMDFDVIVKDRNGKKTENTWKISIED